MTNYSSGHLRKNPDTGHLWLREYGGEETTYHLVNGINCTEDLCFYVENAAGDYHMVGLDKISEREWDLDPEDPEADSGTIDGQMWIDGTDDVLILELTVGSDATRWEQSLDTDHCPDVYSMDYWTRVDDGGLTLIDIFESLDELCCTDQGMADNKREYYDMVLPTSLTGCLDPLAGESESVSMEAYPDILDYWDEGADISSFVDNDYDCVWSGTDQYALDDAITLFILYQGGYTHDWRVLLLLCEDWHVANECWLEWGAAYSDPTDPTTEPLDMHDYSDGECGDVGCTGGIYDSYQNGGVVTIS